ncbi:hypothetical protein BDV98DRAFT_585894 [Pterulicium gracile]|uniref:ABM domain-containing protein n=1 Tax=Pterulicium gracile TaxID=1884261 RepID=A0A5C3Q6A2_9AGAR|nr:hypothetical protein BDV98DRAFT_585894 [Pterula gracilis]
MSNVLETIWVKSAAYSTSPAEIDALINAEFAGVDGVVAKYKGSNVTVKDEHAFVIIWESKEKFDAFFAKAPSGALASKLDGPPTIYSIPLAGADYKKTLSAPIVSFSYSTPKEGVTTETVAPLVEKLFSLQESVKASHGLIRGALVEKPKTYLTLSGWESSEAHHASITAEGVAPVLQELRSYIGEQEVKDVKLTSF